MLSDLNTLGKGFKTKHVIFDLHVSHDVKQQQTPAVCSAVM